MNDRATTRRRRRTGGTGTPPPAGFALFDAGLRLVDWNASFAALRGYPRRLIKAGTPLESFVRFDAEHGDYGAGPADSLARRRLAALKRSARTQREQPLPDGRCLRIGAERLAAGGLLLTCDDVTEPKRRERQLAEEAAAQTAVREVLEAISRAAFDLDAVLRRLVESATRLCRADKGFIFRLDGDIYRLAADYGGVSPGFRDFEARHPMRPGRGTLIGRTALEKRAIHIEDVLADREYEFLESQRIGGFRTLLGVPILRDDVVVGVVALWKERVEPFTAAQIGLVTTFSRQAQIAIENARLFNELETRNRELTEALEQQIATAEILRVISSSPTDIAPVLDAVADNAARLCEAPDVVIVMAEDGALRFAKSVGAFGSTIGADFVIPIDRGSVAGRAVSERRTVHVDDLAAEPEEEYPTGRALQQRYGHHTMIATPMLRGDGALGVIAVLRREVRPFTARQIALLETFADQAVIAIQNARLFREIREKSHQLEIANQHKSAFLANMSHELRTPLNAVIGFSEMLNARYFGELTAKQAEYVTDIHGSGKHLLSLINDILDLSKIEAGRMELESAEFDLRAALDNALTLVRERAQRGGVALRLEADPELRSIEGDERKLKQVVLNLLSNAVRFTPRGGAVGVVAKRVDGAVEIAVTDTGVGIAAADQEAIFEAFRQAGSDVIRKREGTGLGLALVRRFVELHGGTIRVRSAPGRGSTFTVTLPLRHGE